MNIEKLKQPGLVPVPCNGCKECCKGDLIVLHPECGDDPRDYQTERAVNPLSGREVDVLKRKADNSCVYLGESGCTIHGRQPAICREFDCRRLYMSLVSDMSRNERRNMLRKTNLVSSGVMKAGRKRAHTLREEGERV